MSIDTSRANLDADLFIGGLWIEGGAGSLENIDPATGEAVGRVSLATRDQINEAIAAASRAFPAWAALPAIARGDILRKASDILAERVEEAVATILLETGKTEVDARGEIARATWNLRWNGEQAPRVQATGYPGLTPYARRQSVPTPFGPAALISAWNFPAVLATRKLGPALAAGCTVVMKAAEIAPATARLIVEVLEEAGVPSGVVNLVFGDPQMVSTTLTESKDIKVLSFTGSTPVGKLIAAQAAPRLLPTMLELGGHAPVLVMEDADVDHVISTVGPAKFGSAGQSCVAPSRFYVHESLYASFVEKFTAFAGGLRVGHGTDPGTTIGAVAHEGRVEALSKLVDDAVRVGGRVTIGGSQVKRPGFFFEPTVVADLALDSDAEILREEPFGPIATLSSFSTVEEAVEAANSAPFAFAAYLFTSSIAVKEQVLRTLSATNIGINQTAFAMPDVPMGGLGNSGYGYEGGIEGILAYTQLRLVSESAGW